MSLSTLAAAAALVGGVVLVVNLFVGAPPMPWLGGGLVLAGAAAAGAGLARTSWLAVVSALGCGALAWTALEVARVMTGDRQADAVVGGVATLGVAVAAVRGNRAA